VAWWYLAHTSLPEALLRFQTALHRFADSKGAVGNYHETVTVAWMLIIADRLSEPARSGPSSDLFATPSVLGKYYRPATLASERGAAGLCEPDVVAGSSPR
jgi:hypothetical protein